MNDHSLNASKKLLLFIILLLLLLGVVFTALPVPPASSIDANEYINELSILSSKIT